MHTQNENVDGRRLTLPLFWLSCSSSDSLMLERILRQQPGVVTVYANPATEKVYIEYDPALTDEERLVAVVHDAGYGSGRSA
jgi:copper chaperone CopZ